MKPACYYLWFRAVRSAAVIPYNRRRSRIGISVRLRSQEHSRKHRKRGQDHEHGKKNQESLFSSIIAGTHYSFPPNPKKRCKKSLLKLFMLIHRFLFYYSFHRRERENCKNILNTSANAKQVEKSLCGASFFAFVSAQIFLIGSVRRFAQQEIIKCRKSMTDLRKGSGFSEEMFACF